MELKYFYKIENGNIVKGSGYKIPSGFIEYTKDDIPEEVLEDLNKNNYEKLIIDIKSRATSFIYKQFKILDYDNEGEVALYASNSESQWYDEALKLQSWIEGVYTEMYKLLDTITIDNYKNIDLDEIESNYPMFES